MTNEQAADQAVIDSFLAELKNHSSGHDSAVAISEALLTHIGASDYMGWRVRIRQHLPELKTPEKKVRFYEDNEQLFINFVNEIDALGNNDFMYKIEALAWSRELNKIDMADYVKEVFIDKNKSFKLYSILICNVVDSLINNLSRTFIFWYKNQYKAID